MSTNDRVGKRQGEIQYNSETKYPSTERVDESFSVFEIRGKDVTTGRDPRGLGCAVLQRPAATSPGAGANPHANVHIGERKKENGSPERWN